MDDVQLSPVAFIENNDLAALNYFLDENPQLIEEVFVFCKAGESHQFEYNLMRWAIEFNNLDAVNALLSQGFSLHNLCEHLHIPLYCLSVVNANSKLLRLYLDYGLTLDDVYVHFNINSFRIASQYAYGQYERVMEFFDELESLGFDFEKYEQVQGRPFISALIPLTSGNTANQKIAMVQRFLRCNLSVNYPHEHTDFKRKNHYLGYHFNLAPPLYCAILAEHYEIAELLCNNGSNIELLNEYIKYETEFANTLELITSKESIPVRLIEQVLPSEWDVNRINPTGWGAIHHAVFFNNKRVINWLLDNGCDINLQTQELIMVDHDLHIDMEIPKGFSALMLACTCANAPLVDLLLSYGADANRVASNQQTALDVVISVTKDQHTYDALDRKAAHQIYKQLVDLGAKTRDELVIVGD